MIVIMAGILGNQSREFSCTPGHGNRIHTQPLAPGSKNTDTQHLAPGGSK
jgi:hypothetical protein